MNTYPDRPQYINYEAGTKRPVSPTGVPINPHDPTNWMTEDAARATGLPVGFVLTENDPYFLLDIDKQRDPVTGEWSQLATDLCATFQGAGVEVSQSGNGLHVIGTCDQATMTDRRNKWDGCLEFYTQGRYIALSPHGIQGDVTLDYTDRLVSVVPIREDVTGDIPDVGPVPEYTGPTDDDALIAQMCDASGSAAVQFGNKASVAQLWSADAEALARFFPAFDDAPYDASSADASLMAHLAFWTGKDMARMDRLFRRSGLMRDKYERRQDYRTATIRGAAGACQAVYSLPVTGASLPSATDGTVLPEAERLPAEYLTVSDQIEWFAGCVYILATNRVLMPSGDMVDAQRFCAWFGGKEFQMSADGTRPTRNAFEAFTQNRAIEFPRVRETRCTPFEAFGAIRDDMVNIFRHPEVPCSNEPVDRFLDLLQRVLPVQRDRDIFLAWSAAMVQSPGVKFQWSLVLQGVQGNGKTFLMKCIEQAVGQDVSHLPNPEDMGEKYNGYIEGNLFIGVEEIHMSGRRDLMDRLKKYITGDRIECREMGQDKRMVDNLTNWMFLTNYKDAVLKSRDDRRYAVFFTAQQKLSDIERDGMSGAYFPALWQWARSGGFAAVAGFLRQHPVPADLDPRDACHRAPITSSTHEAIDESLGSLEQEILEAVGAELPGFRGGWISSFRLREYLDKRNFRHISPRIMRDAMETIGYVPCGLWRDGRCSPLIQEGGSRPRLYCTAETGASATDVADYLVAQGYST